MITLYPSPTAQEILDAATTIAGVPLDQIRAGGRDRETMAAKRLCAAALSELLRPAPRLWQIADRLGASRENVVAYWIATWRRCALGERMDQMSAIASAIVRSRAAKGWRGRCMHCGRPVPVRRESTCQV